MKVCVFSDTIKKMMFVKQNLQTLERYGGLVYSVLAVSIFLLDNVIKKNIEKTKNLPKKYLNGRVEITRYHNKGMALDILSGKPKTLKTVTSLFFSIAAACFFFVLPKKGAGSMKFAFSLLTGGAASNQYDRIKRGYVVDYLRFGKKREGLGRIVFNLSDFCIFAGCFMAACIKCFEKEKK